MNENENQGNNTLNSYLLSLQKIGGMYNVDKGLEALNKKDLSLEDKVQITQGLGNTILSSPDGFLNESDTHVGNEAMNYQKAHEETVEKAVEKYKGNIVRDYAEILNGAVSENLTIVKEKIEKDERYVTSNGETKKVIMAQNLRFAGLEVVKQFLMGLKLNKDYEEDKELVEAYKAYEALKDEEDAGKMLTSYIQTNKLSSNAINNTYLRNNAEKIKAQSLDVYANVVASKLLGEDGKVDVDKLSKAFDSVESYKAMTPIASKKYQEA